MSISTGKTIVNDQKDRESLSQIEGLKTEVVTTTTSALKESSSQLTGWRLHLTTVGVLLCIYLVNLEFTIVGTALITITNALLGFSKSSWIISGYLITYTAFVIIWSKLSDIIGRKVAINLTMLVFVAFSAGCGASQTMDQLIIMRALQGIGAAGGYSMAVLTVYEMVPKPKYGLYGSLISVTIAAATITGPVFGGLLAQPSTWRWVFYLNLPLGGLAIVLLLIAMPYQFGRRPSTNSTSGKSLQASLQRIDILGATLLLAGSLLLVTALIEAGISFPWHSATIIALLVLAGLSWIGFLSWEWFISRRQRKLEPIFPWRFVSNRPWMGMILTTFLVGIPFNVVVVYLPQRFQVLEGSSAVNAGLRLIPYSALSALSSAVANITCQKANIPPIYLLGFGAVINLIGLVCLSTLPVNGSFPASGYGFEVLTGAGVGTTFGILLLTTPFVVDRADYAVATGAIIQFRFLGGAIGLAIASGVLNSNLKSQLSSLLSSADLQALLQSTSYVAQLSPAVQEETKMVFGSSYRTQYQIMTGFAAAQVFATALLWKRGGQIRTVA